MDRTVLLLLSLFLVWSSLRGGSLLTQTPTPKETSK